MFLKVGGEKFRHDGVHRRGDVPVPQLCFGLAFKLGFQHFDRNDCRHPFPDVVAAEVGVFGL